ncbi:MAG: hypothetical protein AMJ84_07455 [Acidithiobacillales bacterium SM23_46]|nr:MAG: hypothetical protein AMS22_08260 [Thiotrichales bacterium SG8_50]KPK70693.1 MAG: hypothetical protein AMJ84_07455 [Acidithiobacillales bacterium SM23_46]KPL27195.1 MAG: hypothetical protein AMJ72_10235 [Acidithiobacillales bacterium SM1_46]
MLLGALLGIGVASAAPPPNEQEALKLSQAAIGRTLGDHHFVNTAGQPVALSELRGRPLVVSLVYTSCHDTCPTITNQLSRMLPIARDALGAGRFRVVSIGFDAPNDTPERMRAYARSRGAGADEWLFLSADAATIEVLTRELGFQYFPSPRGFDHIAQTTVVDSNGRVYRQVYGDSFEPPALVEPLKELVFGTGMKSGNVSGWAEGIRLFCTVYDPASGRYRFDYSLFVTLIVGVMSLGAVAIFIVRAWRHSPAPEVSRRTDTR